MQNRCVRNNNPLNIVRSGARWIGAYQYQTDSRFVQFVNLTFGFRAAFVTMRTYITKHKLRNLDSIIRRWCPDSTADSYIQFVSKRCDISPFVELPLALNSSLWHNIILSMARYEGFNIKTDFELLEIIRNAVLLI